MISAAKTKRSGGSRAVPETQSAATRKQKVCIADLPNSECTCDTDISDTVGLNTNRGAGDREREHGTKPAKSARNKGRASPTVDASIQLHAREADCGDPPHETESLYSVICLQLKPLRRARYFATATRIKVDNAIGAFIATQYGDGANLDEKERKRLRKLADDNIKCVWHDKPLKHPEFESVMLSNAGILEANGIAHRLYQSQIDSFGKQIEKLVKQLPIAEWLDLPEQRGIGLQSVGEILGETGDLRNYPHWYHVWSRMGCAPYNGKMPSTWRFGKEGKASAEDWVAMGYSPRRRSLMYVIGDVIVKSNKGGPYRQRYDEAKQKFAELHPDYSNGRCHSHGMLLASKLLLKNLWLEMNRA